MLKPVSSKMSEKVQYEKAVSWGVTQQLVSQAYGRHSVSSPLTLNALI